MLKIHRFPEYWFSRTSNTAVSPHQSLRKKVGVMAARVPYPHLRLAVCGVWLAFTLLVFTSLGSSSSHSVIYLIAAAIIPPCIFLTLWNEGPPATVAELLRATEDRR